MPELPEAETIARKISQKISGRVLSRAVLHRRDILKTGTAENLKSISFLQIQKVYRRGKCVLILLEKDYTVCFHLGMTGQLIWTGEKPAPLHVHAEFYFSGISEALFFRDIRRFGGISILRSGLTSQSLNSLGPEPLEISGQGFEDRLKMKKGRLKPLLMDQKFLAGIGNIYADEILFHAKIHPRKKAQTLSLFKIAELYQAIQKILQEAVQDGGSSIDDYIHPDGGRGLFQKKHRVYARQGKPCFICGSKIRRIVLSGRSACFCPICQK